MIYVEEGLLLFSTCSGPAVRSYHRFFCSISMVKQLVISHSTKDKELAQKLKQILSDADYDVWTAEAGLGGSVKWTQTILDVIDDRDGLVLLWSPDAAKSVYVREEIRIARVFLKPIFPVLAYPKNRST